MLLASIGVVEPGTDLPGWLDEVLLGLRTRVKVRAQRP